MSSEQDIKEIVAIIGAAYPNFTPTAHTVEIYYQTLKDIESDELRIAVLHCVSEAGRKFAPSVGEIRGAISELRQAVRNIPDAYQAWQEVWKGITTTGSWGEPKWSNPLIEKAVDSLNWRNLCMSENSISDRARFVEAYDGFLARAQREDMFLPQVKTYIESKGGKMLGAPIETKQLEVET